jgi:hypothetical protein
MTKNLQQTSWNVINSNIIGISKQFDRLSRYIYRVDSGQILSESEEDICNTILESLDILIKTLEATIEDNKSPLQETGFYDASIAMLFALQEQLTTTKEILGLTEFWTDLPDIITVYDPTIVDGDTIGYHQGKEIRFVGIDTHEIGTRAGVVERNHLVSLMSGKNVVIYIDPYRKMDRYDRILGVPFVDGENICHLMLKQFGEYILTPSKYHKRYKHVDWDENKLIAQSREIPIIEPVALAYAEEVGELNITSSPTYAKIALNGSDTGLRTAETIKNIPVGDYDVTLTKEGYNPASGDVSVSAGKVAELNLKLEKIPAPPKEKIPSRTTLETHFKQGVINETDARDGLADLGYTNEEIDNYLFEWIKELSLSQIGNIYKKNIATKVRVTYYLQTQGYTDADIDGLFIAWDKQIQEEAEASLYGNLYITAEPQYSDVYLDGENWKGVTPLLLRGVDPGTHTIKCTAYQHQDETIQATVIAGQQTTAHLVLTKTNP